MEIPIYVLITGILAAIGVTVLWGSLLLRAISPKFHKWIDQFEK